MGKYLSREKIRENYKKYMDYDDGIYYFNPGSLGRAGEEGKSYGVCDVLKSGIMTNFINTL